MKAIAQWVMNNPQWVGVFLYSLLEGWLGKTSKVKSNSIIGLIFNAITRRKL